MINKPIILFASSSAPPPLFLSLEDAVLPLLHDLLVLLLAAPEFPQRLDTLFPFLLEDKEEELVDMATGGVGSAK